MVDVARNRYLSLITVFAILLFIEFNYVSRTTKSVYEDKATESNSIINSIPEIATEARKQQPMPNPRVILTPEHLKSNTGQKSSKLVPSTAEESVCSSVKKIFFLKTHKTASSTIQNLLFRFGERNDLNFALPKNNGARFSYPAKLTRQMIKPLVNENDEIHILCNHAVANKNIREVIPGAKTITILRSIPSLYESSFGYFKNEVKEYKNCTSLVEFYKDPSKYYDLKNRNGMSHFAHNHIAFDLGYSTEVQKTDVIESIVDDVLRNYDLILLSDYFFESMILLKESFCWEWKDVLYFVTNQRVERKEIDQSLATKIETWNNIDAAIYAAANQTFWEKYSKIVNIDDKHKLFQKELDTITQFCLESEGRNCAPNDPKCSMSVGVKLKGFNLREEAKNSPLCQDLVRPELAYIRKLFKRQWPDWTYFYGG